MQAFLLIYRRFFVVGLHLSLIALSNYLGLLDQV
jgi:hypothetical protein